MSSIVNGDDTIKPMKPRLSMIVIGHVDSGKSTTTGHLLFKLGKLDKRVLDRLEKEASGLGKSSFKFAFVMDTMRSERERGITVDIAMWPFITSKFLYTVIDAPGHRDFIKNMSVGAAAADVAVLMLAASESEFKAGWAKNGQTREHALLAYSLGVRQIICCVNKIDEASVNYSEKRFNTVKTKVLKFLSKIGYDIKKIPVIPISGFHGDNLLERSPNTMWYDGPTMVQALDSMNSPERFTQYPLRIPIQDAYKLGGIGVVCVGRIESGTLRPGMKVTFSPSGVTGEVKGVEMHHETMTEVSAGDCVGFHFKNLKLKDVGRGMVCSEAQNNTAFAVKSFTARIMVINHPGQISCRYTPVVDVHTAHIACEFEEILEKIDKRTGKVIELKPRFIESGDCAIVRLAPTKPLCLDTYEDFSFLGRFAIRDMQQTVAIGQVITVNRHDTTHGGKKGSKR